MQSTILAVIGSLLVGGTMLSGELFETGFEGRDYTAGQPLAGQDGWTAIASPNGAEVVSGRRVASSGRRAVSCWGGGDLDTVAGLLDGAYEQVVPFDPITNPKVVRVKADVKLDGPDTGNGPGADMVSANLMARNSLGLGRSPFMYLSSNGNVYAGSQWEGAPGGGSWYQFETPICFGEYNELAMSLDYATHICTFEVNGHEIGTLPFGGSGEQWRGPLLEFAAYADPVYGIDPTLYTGFWDNVEVEAKPVRHHH